MADKPKTKVIEDGSSYRIINASDFDEKTMKEYGGVMPADVVTDLLNRNGDGTFSEPTPTDIRFPNKDMTEFANNHGAHVRKSAAQMREDEGLPDAPGGLAPDPELAEKVKKAQEAAAEHVEGEVKKAEEAKKDDPKLGQAAAAGKTK